MKRASDILRELVAVRSDTGTSYECTMGKKIYELIQKSPYFQQHPELCGMYTGQDLLKRPVVWALRRGKSDKTVVFSAHYDAVETKSYGALEPYALCPDQLKEKMLQSELIGDDIRQSLTDPGWMVGRGAADCKSGIAENLYVLFHSTNYDGNILFTAVHDEENLSAGARQCIDLYQALKETFHLEYIIGIITEPDSYKENNGAFSIAEGCVGKILPIVVAKGVISHAALMLYGLNSSYIIAEIVRRIELNEQFHSCEQNRHTHPSTTLFMKDLKELYDVSIPEFSAAGFNILFHESTNVAYYLQEIKSCCCDAARECIDRYTRTYLNMVQHDAVEKRDMLQLHARVLTVKELLEELKHFYPDLPERLEQISTTLSKVYVQEKLTVQQAAVEYLKQLITLYQFPGPVIVIGIAPPYYPAVTNNRTNTKFERILDGLVSALDKSGYASAFRDPYNAGPTDLCYMFCNNASQSKEVMHELCVPRELYDIDFSALEQVNIPSVLLGATGKDVHKMTERVWLDDVDNKIPYILEEILRLSFQD